MSQLMSPVDKKKTESGQKTEDTTAGWFESGTSASFKLQPTELARKGR
jgi:hypothetical protein